MTWDDTYKSGIDFTPLNEIQLKKIIEDHKISGSVLDLGCGTGKTLSQIIQFAPQATSLTGLDFSPEAVQLAQDRFKDIKNVPITIRQFDLTEIACDSFAEPFDLVVCKLVLAFIPDREKFLEAINTCLMHTDSTFLLMTPVSHENIHYTQKDKPGIMVPYKELLPMVEKYFNVVERIDNYCGERDHRVILILKK